MSKIVYYVSDFFKEEEAFGGAGMSDYACMQRLSNRYDIIFKHISYKTLRPIDPKSFYIVSNRSLFPSAYLGELRKANYIIHEHDYQFDKGFPGTDGRNPYAYNSEGLVPEEYKMELAFYNNAKAIFLQTDFHKSIYDLNNIGHNRISLKTTFFSVEEISLLRKVLSEKVTYTRSFCVLASGVWLKGVKEAEQLCKNNNWDFGYLHHSDTREEFLNDLSKYSTLVFLPLTPESCCRLVMEARMLGLNVITSRNYGAPLSSWFNLKEEALISTIDDIMETSSVPSMGKYIESYVTGL